MKKVFALLLVLLICLTGCSNANNEGDGDSETSSTINFAVLAPLTGNYAEFGKSFKVAMGMAADEINAAGGVNGKTIELTIYDSKGDAAESSDLARQIVDDEKYVACIGDFSSGASMADAPIFGDAGMVLLSPTASNSQFTPMNDYMFSIMGLTNDESQFFMTYLVKKFKGKDNVAIVYANTEWGNQVNEAMVEQAKVDGTTIVADEPVAEGEIDYSNVLNKVKASNPELLILALQTVDCAHALNSLAQIGWDIEVVSQGASSSAQVIEIAGENAEGLCSTTSFFIDESNSTEKAWLDKFVEGAGFSPTVHAAVAYDAVYIMAEAAKACGDEVTREGIHTALKNMGTYQGFTGPIEFDETGSIFRKVLIVQVENGKFVRKTDYNYGD